MPLSEFHKNYFKLFNLSADFTVDQAQLGASYRQLQQELHPDRYANASAQQQRIAVQYSALVNEAYATLRNPLLRALYLLEQAGLSGEDVAGQQVDGGFLITQMELREKLESLGELVEPETVLDHLVNEIKTDVRVLQEQFSHAFTKGDLTAAASACVKMQYLEKLLQEAEEIETRMLDNE
jgi:molecular chaperone HscB